MTTSAEHQFVAQELGSVLELYSSTRLFGVLEADRKQHDYACMLERDCERPLVAQVLWSHAEGVHKDLMALLLDGEAALKVYLVKDTIKHRLKIDEVISQLRNNDKTKDLLRGLKLIFLPAEFDADQADEQQLMSNFISRILCEDLLFATVFGRLTPWDIRLFANHGGPFGLKYAVLAEITQNGLMHNPTFKRNLGYDVNSPLREAITMMSALGLVRSVDGTNVCLPTLKGRMFLDLTRHLLFENAHPQHALGELGMVKDILFGTSTATKFDYRQEMVSAANYSKTEFGRDLLEGIAESAPVFHCRYEWKGLYDRLNGPSGMTFEKDLFIEPDCFFYAP
jgi:hypothetical protein